MKSLFFPPRNFRDELLDLDEAPYEEVRDSLVDVATVNRYLSGYRVLLHHAEKILRRHNLDRAFTVLDAATGSADQPIALAKLARKMILKSVWCNVMFLHCPLEIMSLILR